MAAIALVIASCGVRAPSRIDVTTLVKASGAVEARHVLQVRIVADPKDLGARLALAALDEQTGRPSGAIVQLEAVVAVGGPIGTRWHADDRARLGRLLAARGRARLDRGAPSAHPDLVRARELGAKVEEVELAEAQSARAIAQLRHVDAGERAEGRRTLAALTKTPIAVPPWRGASTTAGAADRGAFGVWLWSVRARRAAWDELRAWHEATPGARDATVASAYLAARAWWAIDALPPDAAELVGPHRCRYVTSDGCAAALLARREPRDSAAIAALLAAPPVRATTPDDAVAWLTLTLSQALAGEVGWGAAFATRVELASIATTAIAPPFRATFARLAGRGDAGELAVSAELLPAERIVIAAGRALRGAPVAEVRAALGPAADTDDGRALLHIVAPAVARPLAPYATAIVEHVRARVSYGPDVAALRRIVDAYLRDPAIADRIALDVTAEAVDAAVAYAAIGAMFDAFGDPGRARTAWQAAVDASPEVEHVRGLAEAMTRANDPDAALVTATRAAAAWGDPAVVLISVARVLESTGEHVHALEAARSAIDLAGPDLLDDALEVAIDASRSLGRHAQAEALLARRAKLAPPLTTERDDDPTDAAAALGEYRRRATVSAVARMWVASRWNPRHVAIRASLRAAISVDDPRRGVIEAELVALASDRDPALGRDAVAALR